MDSDLDELLGAVRRMVAALGRHAAAGDTYELAELATLHSSVDDALAAGVDGLREGGYSDAAIGSALGVSRQAVAQRWPHTRKRAGAARRWH